MADSIRVLEIKKNIYANNDKEAATVRAQLKADKTFLLNVMGSPGSGKTTFILGLIARLKDKLRLGVMEADLDSVVDAEKVALSGVRVNQLHTGGMCHLDATMTGQGLEDLGAAGLDCVILENIGNLICPAEFDTGASKSIMLLSVPEGDDKALKYPVMFTKVDALVVTKLDCAAYFDFNLEALKERAKKLNPGMVIFETSAKTGAGMDAVADWLLGAVADWRA